MLAVKALLTWVNVSVCVLLAQSSDIWREGAWTVQAPLSTNCGSLPLLQAKGPGSLFDASNASVLASLERALPGALSKVCPAAQEAILVSGRGRRLLKLAPHSIPSAADATPAAPSRSAATPVLTAREMTPDPVRRTVAIAPAPIAPSAPTGPRVLPASTDLRSLSSARKIEDKCEVLMSWLETSKSEAEGSPNYRYRAGKATLNIFRDEPMMAVFGTPYDKTENRWRLEQHEKVISHCLGIAPSRSAFHGARPNQTMLQYRQQFDQYRQLLDQAFLGQSGPFEPTAITRHVQQVREQLAWANQALASAVSAAPTQTAFEQISSQRQAAARELALLSSPEKARVNDFLARRQIELAPVIAENWLRDAGATEKTVPSARTLHAGHALMTPIVRTLDAPARAGWDNRYQHLVGSLIAGQLQAELARLHALPTTLGGVMQLSSWKAGFDSAFHDLHSVTAVSEAETEYSRVRTRIYAGALPSWLQQVESVPVDAAAITAKRRELDALFPAREDRSSPAFVQYESPLRAREDQLRLRVADEIRRKQEAQIAMQRPAVVAAAAPQSTTLTLGPVTENSFSAKGLSNQGVLTSLFRGDFANIDFERDDLKFGGLFGIYLKSYGTQCKDSLPKNKVEMTTQRCSQYWVTRNGFGTEINRSCSNWETVGTGLYANPVLYNAKLAIDRIAAGDAFRNGFRMMTQMSQGDPFASAGRMIGDLQTLASDVGNLVSMNGCESPGLRRFEENLRLFALNKQPVRLGGPSGPPPALVAVPGLPYRDHDYAKLVEDLVSEQSKTWAMNRFISGSVNDVSVTSRDEGGRPAKIAAAYSFNGFSNSSRGTVTLTFSEGSPECLYFYDFPSTCRTANRRIVAAYAEGAYQK